MATRADFTDQGCETSHKGVTGAGLLVSSRDRGFFDTFKRFGQTAGGGESAEGAAIAKVESALR